MKIYIDAMGGDQAPKVVIKGASLAAKVLPTNASIILLGPKTQIEPWVKKYFKRLAKPEIIDCSEVIEMNDSAVQSVRAKKNSSIVQGLSLASKTSNSAFFSAGHSGAIFAAALITMGRIDGVERPCIATALPTINGHCILLDAGANVECRPQHLSDFACMGATYAKVYLKKNAPVVGILSNGEEDSKGTELTRQAHQILKSDPAVLNRFKSRDIHYMGYIEGKEIFHGGIDVVVTDGFTGNVVLKSLEGLGKTITHIMKTELKRNWFTKLGTLFSLPALHRVQKKLDYSEVGSAPLLGVNGNCFIGHGRSNAKAIKNGIFRAYEAIQMNLSGALKNTFQSEEKSEETHENV